jgi:acetamidase/formamidase
MREHLLSAAPTHSRWNADFPPRLTISSGDIVHFECVDSSGAQVHPALTVDEFQHIDRGLIHALTGPVAIEHAAPGDVLQIDVLDVQHKGWGWSSVVPGLGFLKQRFADPFLFHWKLDRNHSHSLAPANLPLRPFCGIMGVAPAGHGEFRTRPPGIFGGNMDVRELAAGATLYLPVQQPGALFSCGDAHAAQGDGEVCINGIECPADVSLRFTLHPQQALSAPLIETAPSDESGPSWLIVESHTDTLTAALNATDRMVDLLVSRWEFEPVHAYLLCSVAMKLQISQVVNEPMITVSAAIAKNILPPRTLFPAQGPA